MHELGIAQNILEIVREHVPEAQATLVRSVKVRIGDFAGVVADSLEFCFSAIVAEGPFTRARMEIERVPTRGACGGCSREFNFEGAFFLCPECGSVDIRLLSGRELDVVAIELEEAEVS